MYVIEKSTDKSSGSESVFDGSTSAGLKNDRSQPLQFNANSSYQFSSMQSGDGQPIVTQPTDPGSAFVGINGSVVNFGMSDGWIAIPLRNPDFCPPELELLNSVDKIFIKQKVNIPFISAGKNTYTIKNENGHKLYNVVEESDCCGRSCLGSWRSFDLRIMDGNGTEIIHIKRRFRWSTQQLRVYAPPGNFAGSVVEECTFLIPKFDVKNEDGNTVLKIKGPHILCGDVEFKVLSKNKETVVGKISKEWSGLAREFLTNADNFGISFPINLPVRMKAVMIGACFLIDFIYFEDFC